MATPQILQRLFSNFIPARLRFVGLGEDKGECLNTDNVNLVLNKLSEAFNSGEVINPPKGMVQPNKLTDWTSLETRFYEQYKRHGVCYMFCKPSSVFVLEDRYLELEVKTNATIFNTESFMEAVKSAYYTTSNTRVDLLLEEGEIVPLYDLGMNSDFMPINRLAQISATCKLSHKTNEALIGAMIRTALAFVFKKQGDKIKAPLDKTQEKAQKDRDEFQGDFNLNKGGVQYASQPMEIAEANPDTRKLQGIEVDTHALKKICTQMGLAHTLVFEDAKYDNATVYVSIMYDQTIMPDAKKWYDFLNKQYNSKMYRDYTSVKDSLIQGYGQKETTTTEQEGQEGSQGKGIKA